MNAKTDLSISSSNSKLTIEPRKVRFSYADIDRADFHGGNIVTSAFWAALSATFPAGEGEFIRSVKLFESQIEDSKLLEEVKDFSAQEAHHSLQHKLLNKQLVSVGYPIEKIENFIDKKITERVEKWSAVKRLRRTVCAEHFTATMAHYALVHPESLDASPDVFKKMMLWHAIEEVEHKSVAFDVYVATDGDLAALRRHYAYFAFIEFPMNMWAITRFLIKEGGFSVTWKDRREFIGHLFGKKGMYSSMRHLYFMFMKKGFHPWNHDDSELVNEWKDELSPYFIV